MNFLYFYWSIDCFVCSIWYWKLDSKLYLSDITIAKHSHWACLPVIDHRNSFDSTCVCRFVIGVPLYKAACFAVCHHFKLQTLRLHWDKLAAGLPQHWEFDMGHVSGFVEFCGSELWVRTNSQLCLFNISFQHTSTLLLCTIYEIHVCIL